MSSRAAGQGGADTIRENFGLQALADPVLVIPTVTPGLLIEGPEADGQILLIKSFSRVVNTSGATRTVSFYMKTSVEAIADACCIGKDMSLPADQWAPFGELYLPYGFNIYGVASGTGVNLVPCCLLED